MTAPLGMVALLCLQAPPSPPPVAATDSRVYELVASDSNAGFTITTTWHDVHGSTRGVRGTISLPAGLTTAGARVEVEVEAASLTTESKARDRDVHDNFLEVKLHPLLRFHSEKVTGTIQPGRESTVEVEGEFEAHGVTVPIHATVTCGFDDNQAEFHVRFPLSLKAFRIRSPSRWFAKASDGFEAYAHLRARILPGVAPAATPAPASAP